VCMDILVQAQTAVGRVGLVFRVILVDFVRARKDLWREARNSPNGDAALSIKSCFLMGIREIIDVWIVEAEDDGVCRFFKSIDSCLGFSLEGVEGALEFRNDGCCCLRGTRGVLALTLVLLLAEMISFAHASRTFVHATKIKDQDDASL
jgi:hypothetical protein